MKTLLLQKGPAAETFIFIKCNGGTESNLRVRLDEKGNPSMIQCFVYWRVKQRYEILHRQAGNQPLTNPNVTRCDGCLPTWDRP
jgi:hypothetical protein